MQVGTTAVAARVPDADRGGSTSRGIDEGGNAYKAPTTHSMPLLTMMLSGFCPGANA